jgi:hypothetical protein
MRSIGEAFKRVLLLDSGVVCPRRLEWLLLNRGVGVDKPQTEIRILTTCPKIDDRVLEDLDRLR